MAYRRRRRLSIDPDLVHTVSTQYHKGRTGHYGIIGHPLRNYKDQVVKIPTVTQRRTSPVSETYGNKILPKRMAYRRRKTFRPRKRFVARRRRRLSAVPLTFPRTKLVRFRVVTNGTLTGTTGALGGIALKANALNDPTSTFSAYLPSSLDQWAGMYQKYIVLGSKCKVRVVPTTNTGGGIVGLHLADNNTLLTTTASEYKMLPRTVQRIVTTQKDLAYLSMSYSGKKFWSLSNIKDDSEQEAVFSTTPGDPTDVAYYHLYVSDLQGGHTFTAELQVEIEYICLLSDPVQLAFSGL